MHNRFWYLLSKKLSKEASDAEVSELDQLLDEHPVWQARAEEVEAFWQAKPAQAPEDNAFQRHLTRMEQQGQALDSLQEYLPPAVPQVVSIKQSNRKWYWIGGVAAGLIGVLFTVAWLYRPPAATISALADTSTHHEITTPKGNRSKVVLPDGTQVWLNADSKLEYNSSFGKTNREVTLSGEAFFDVVKNQELPFLIHTSRFNIKVTGTAFNVKAYPGDEMSETSIIRGKVEVTVHDRPDEKYVLRPHEKIVVHNDATISPKQDSAAHKELRLAGKHLIELGYINYAPNDSLASETSWMYNRLEFDEESFEQIVRKMERWYGVKIILNDAGLAHEKLSYKIKNESVDEALRNMQHVTRFQFTLHNNQIIITR